MDASIPEKANRVLNIIILGLILILIRVWYLSVVQHDEHLEKARRPQRRTVVEKVERATIRDRFNIPLALNKIQYNAAVCYADIRQIPSVKWEKNEEGKRVRVPVRSQYISELAKLLSAELQMDWQVIEDTIHAKASLFPHTPFILKEDLSEEQYYRLKMMEREWAGVRAERGSKRYYPMGEIGADAIGYMGAISSNEYYQIAQEIKVLQAYLIAREEGEMPILPKGFQNPLEVRERLKTLQEKAYTINDLVGKAGIESSFDQELRGYPGKKIFEIDTKGNLLRELPGGRKSVSGQRVILSISSELQEYAEQLLADNEKVRESRLPNGEVDWGTPWIKGGAIVAMDPKTGEVLALASYPRVDPNDFIPSRDPEVRAQKQAGIVKWLENEAYIGEIWDGKRPMERERFDTTSNSFYEESAPLSLMNYLLTILPYDSEVIRSIEKVGTIKGALQLQEAAGRLIGECGAPFPSQLEEGDNLRRASIALGALYSTLPHKRSRFAIPEKHLIGAQMRLQAVPHVVLETKKILDSILGPIPHNDDKILCLDLCQMLVFQEPFTPELTSAVGHLPLSLYRELNQSAVIVQHTAKQQVREWFHQIDFQLWRQEHFKAHLAAKRKEEKEKKQYTRPYTEYLEQIENQMFKEFWNAHRYVLTCAFIAPETALDEQLLPYAEKLKSARSANPAMRKHLTRLQQALSPLSFDLQIQFLKTMRPFEELSRPLYGRYRQLRNTKKIQLEKHLAAAFYPLSGYGYGRSQAFRQSTPQGSVFKLVVAYQALLERFTELKANHQNFIDANPLTLIDSIKWHAKPGSNEQILGYTLDGKPILRLYKGGRLPRGHPNIGKIDVRGGLEQSSNIYFSILAVDHLSDPLNLIHASRNFGFGEKSGIELPGEITGSLPSDIAHDRTGLYAFAIGQHSLIVTPLQSAVMLSAIGNGGHVLKPKVVHAIAGQESLSEYRDPFSRALYPFQENLALVGIHFPLFTATGAESNVPNVWYNTAESKRTLPMDPAIREPLIEGLHRVLIGAKGLARPQAIRALYRNPEWKKNYLELKRQLIGKTGTAEILYKQSIDAQTEAKIHNQIWFSGIAFSEEDDQNWMDPELTIVVYLRLSESGGKEAAPLAAQMVKKWREIKRNKALKLN